MYAFSRTHASTSSWLCAPAVFMDGLQLKMRPSETQQQHVLDDLGGSSVFSLNWDLQFPELGNTAEITTAFMRVVVWLSPETFSAEVSQRASPLPGQMLPLCSSGASVCTATFFSWASACLVRTWLAKRDMHTPGLHMAEHSRINRDEPHQEAACRGEGGAAKSVPTCAFELSRGNAGGVMLAARHSECAQWGQI